MKFPDSLWRQVCSRFSFCL